MTFSLDFNLWVLLLLAAVAVMYATLRKKGRADEQRMRNLEARLVSRSEELRCLCRQVDHIAEEMRGRRR